MSNSIEKLAKEAERLAENLQGNPFPAFDRIAKDIRERQDNAMAMEFTKCIGELLRKNGITPKIKQYGCDFYGENSFSSKYGVIIDELDFSEHDKVFEDKIADLQQRIRELIKEKDEYKRKCNNFGFENQELEQRIAELESKNEQLKCDIDKMAESNSKWIDRAVEWQQKCEKLESKETSDLPFDPLECANYLINATYERETSSLERAFAKVPDKVNSDRYTIDELEQIAEHLLVYCKHNKESEE